MLKIKRLALLTLAASGLVFYISSCKKDDKKVVTDTSRSEVVANYAKIVFASYSDAVTMAKELKTAATTLTTAPSQASLDAARTAYIAARTPYGQTDAFRFYGGPIDDDNGKEGDMNGWPLDEDYIDYVVNQPKSGIINDTVNFPVINKDILQSVNGKDGETKLSTGYHAIEFLLWGQDLSTTGPGNRPYTDYVVGTGTNALRRAQYLLAVIDLLIDDLQYTADAWAPGQNNYRKNFEAQDANVSLQLILTGLGKFTKGELYGERMSTAYETRSQEDEHSCFSDQTHEDFILGQEGIMNVFYGTYTDVYGNKITGKGVYDLINAANPTEAAAAKNAITAADAAVHAIHPPFDQEIVTDDGRVRVKAAIDAGFAQATQLIAVAQGLGITITL